MTGPTGSGDSSQLTVGDPTHYILAEKRMYLDSGLLGRFFGASSNAAMNVSGLSVLVLLGTGVVMIFIPGKISAEDYFKIATPLITLALGYMFGKRGGRDGS